MGRFSSVTAGLATKKPLEPEAQSEGEIVLELPAQSEACAQSEVRNCTEAAAQSSRRQTSESATRDHALRSLCVGLTRAFEKNSVEK